MTEGGTQGWRSRHLSMTGQGPVSLFRWLWVGRRRLKRVAIYSTPDTLASKGTGRHLGRVHRGRLTSEQAAGRRHHGP